MELEVEFQMALDQELFKKRIFSNLLEFHLVDVQFMYQTHVLHAQSTHLQLSFEMF